MGKYVFAKSLHAADMATAESDQKDKGFVHSAHAVIMSTSHECLPA